MKIVRTVLRVRFQNGHVVSFGSEESLELAQPHPGVPTTPISPHPRLLNRLKGDGVRTIIEKKILSTENWINILMFWLPFSSTSSSS